MATTTKHPAYLLITLESGPDALEAAAVALTDLGADGVIEENTGTSFYVKAYFSAEGWDTKQPELMKRLKTVQEYFPSIKLVEERLASETDWLENWKKFHKPVVIGPLWIGPPWQVDEAEAGSDIIVIDPATAFGTGAHATTRLCIEALVDILADEQPDDMLDVGTGSGVLAIAAVKLGVKHALGTDIDPDALAAALGNSERNNVAQSVEVFDATMDQLIDSSDKTYALITANLTGPLHKRLVRDMVKVVAPGGHLVASGILIEESQSVVDAYEQAGLVVDKIRYRDEWAGLVLVKPGNLNESNGEV